MNEQNLKYIANLKAQDVPWSRLTTAYGRASEFPEIFKKLALVIEACDAARGSGGEQNLKSKSRAGQNLKSGSGCGQNSTDAARCGAAQNSVNLAQTSESKFQKADNEAAKFKAGGETELKTDAAKCGKAEFKSADSAAIKFKASQASKFKTSAADKSSDASEWEKFDSKALQDALSKIFNEIEHQSTLWHATPFALLFLARFFMQARAVAGKNANKNNQNAAADKKQNDAVSRNSENENGENEAVGFIAARLGGFFAFMIEICDDADKISHVAPLANFSDMLAEKYLWPQSDENDEERWEEHFYDDELFYSLYFYSRAVLDATGVDFAQFKSGPGWRF
ncbi:hypothetical protein [uncultured Campylobacter sp.]|uniref:hypothetical protein n=1 Tax=uncultured Campylobacter sp. TaxID=218934 RepID=UPI00263309FA|nr:hypothetical protein [uncultured Campylobacter sp.]